MEDLNQVTLLGNVATVEVKEFNNGSKVGNITMATNETWKKDGERQQKTQWHTVKIISQGTIENYLQYIGKGDRLLVVGSIEYRKYEKDGETKYFTEIVVGPYRGMISKQSRSAGVPENQDDDGVFNDDITL